MWPPHTVLVCLLPRAPARPAARALVASVASVGVGGHQGTHCGHAKDSTPTCTRSVDDRVHSAVSRRFEGAQPQHEAHENIAPPPLIRLPHWQVWHDPECGATTQRTQRRRKRARHSIPQTRSRYSREEKAVTAARAGVCTGPVPRTKQSGIQRHTSRGASTLLRKN